MLSDTLNMTGPIFVMYMIALGGLGLIVGSFLNVVAYRVPIGMSITHPRSACPTCKNQIAAYDNIPVISWLLLRGKCRNCRTPIPDRYPFVEISTSILWMVLGLWAWHPNQIYANGSTLWIDPLLPLLLIMGSVGVALWLIDLDHLRLPDVLTLPLYPIAFVGLAFSGFMTGEWPIGTALLSALAWLLFFGGIWFFTAGRGMGFGDVKLAPVLALVLGWVGWGPSVVGIFAGFFIGGMYGISLLLRSKAKKRSRIPYGPFLMLGALVGLLLGDPIWSWYLTTMNL